MPIISFVYTRSNTYHQPVYHFKLAQIPLPRYILRLLFYLRRIAFDLAEPLSVRFLRNELELELRAVNLDLYDDDDDGL